MKKIEVLVHTSERGAEGADSGCSMRKSGGEN